MSVCVQCRTSTASDSEDGCHQLQSPLCSSTSVVGAQVGVGLGGGARQHHVTDHSVLSLLQSTPSSSSAVDESYPGHRHHHSCNVMQLSRTAAFLPPSDPGHVTYRRADVTVDVRLEHKDLWDRFNSLGTEMVITKSGRYDVRLRSYEYT